MKCKLKAWVSYQRARLLRATGLLWLAKRRMAKRGIVVLTFHRILPDDEFADSSSLPSILVRQPTFERFIDWASQECEIVDLGLGVPSWNTSAPRPRIALTFDDGWLDNYEPLQRTASRHSVTATVFICPGIMGRRFPFWPERVTFQLDQLPGSCTLDEIVGPLDDFSSHDRRSVIIEKLKGMTPTARQKCLDRLDEVAISTADDCNDEPLNSTMTWEQVQELQRGGITIGSHTVSHPILTQVSAASVREELTDSRRQIESRLDDACLIVAYPNGNHDETVRRHAGDAGYSLGFTTEAGCWTRASELLRIPRINISEKKLIDPAGRFSPAMAEYALFWHSFRGRS
jgi:peptidoglycan/xylan/chitin deacetylase (PgdA/CDA1 family)